MGCDIHGFLQLKFDEKFWLNKIDLGYLLNRNYTLFGALSNVRNHDNITGKVATDGFPDNPCIFNYDSNYYHSVGWFTFDDLNNFNWSQYINFYDTDLWNSCGNSINDLYSIMKYFVDNYGKENVRCIIWYDN